MRTVKTRFPLVGSVRSRKNVTFVLADKRGGHMLESKHDLKLENCWILQGPEKRGPKLSISG